MAEFNLYNNIYNLNIMVPIKAPWMGIEIIKGCRINPMKHPRYGIEAM
jgi:hypothetical protein